MRKDLCARGRGWTELQTLALLRSFLVLGKLWRGYVLLLRMGPQARVVYQHNVPLWLVRGTIIAVKAYEFPIPPYKAFGQCNKYFMMRYDIKPILFAWPTR